MNLAVLGAQWGDEGKGKIIDVLTPRFDIVARYQGGHNAGHTVYANGRKFVLRLLPSGILHPNKICVLGNGMVIDPKALFEELDELKAAGIDTTDRVIISARAHLILPYHRDLENVAEAARGERKIGTTGRGIGLSYEDKIARRGIRVGDLRRLADEGFAVASIKHAVDTRNQALGNLAEPMAWYRVVDDLKEYWRRLEPMVGDCSLYLDNSTSNSLNVLFEGAQGTMLDIDHGTYPYVTSSNATAGGICTGLGVGPTAIDAVIGVAKAYITRVGEGPLPTELHNTVGERLRKAGSEYGAVTGRPRRCGWFDAVVARYATRVNGLSALVITKLDILDDLPKIKIGTHYELDGSVVEDMPDNVEDLARCQPVYKMLEGWGVPTVGITCFEDLPVLAQKYIHCLEDETGIPVGLISTGPQREHVIIRGVVWSALGITLG